MKFHATARRLSILLLGGSLSLTCSACARTTRAQSASQTTGSAPSGASPTPLQTRSSQTAPSRTAKTAEAAKTQTGGWHYFGHASRSAPKRTAATSGWHYFGPAKSATVRKPEPAPIHSALSRQSESVTRAPKPVYHAPIARPAPVRQQYTAVSTREMERQMFDLINRDRANPANDDSGVPLRPLRWSEKLEEVAREAVPLGGW